MGQTYFPFDSGQGANITETQWAKMAQHWLGTGVIKDTLNNLETYADSTGMQVKVKSGAAWIKGHYFESDAEEVLAINEADSSNPRIDRVIVRLDWTANTVQLAILQGAAAVSPNAPALTQNSSRWEIPLAQIRVNASVSTIVQANVTDERKFVKNANTEQSKWVPLVLQNGWGATGSPWDTPSVMKDEMGFVHFKGSINGGVTTKGTVLFTLPAGYRPKMREFIGINTFGSTTLQASNIIIHDNGNVITDNNVGNGAIGLGSIPSFQAVN